MGMVASVVRTVQPGADCSHPVGRREVYFFTDYRLCLHSDLTSHDVRLSMRGRTWEQSLREAFRFADVCREMCHVAGVTYSVEDVDEESPDRAPLA